ncbi:MAG: AbrB/MazE/SpoVT family DNA-binding domain-containing protein [Opitutae bacterium]|nr:AbrB/MazE/SpoVT family DNA-binding domain-containing protein [Opitutae bacterium]
MQTNLLSETVQFTTKGQVVIPAKFRKEFEIEEGTKASVTMTPEGILLRPITRSYIKSLRGSLRGRGVMKSMMADRKHERAL